MFQAKSCIHNYPQVIVLSQEELFFKLVYSIEIFWRRSHDIPSSAMGFDGDYKMGRF